MVKTRAQRKKSASRRRVYRKRVKNSTCRGKKKDTCVKTKGCKYTAGKKRKYCRKTRNNKMMRGGWWWGYSKEHMAELGITKDEYNTINDKKKKWMK